MIIECATCGAEKYIRPCHKRENNFCSISCYGEWQKDRLKGVNKIVLYCESCGNKLERFPSQVSESNFCNLKCAGKAQSSKIAKESHHNWRGGISPRSILKQNLWRGEVFKRDEYTCQKCGKLGGDLNAHHILGYARYKEARWKVSNGITFCKECHDKFHNTYTKTRFTEEDLVEFLND